MADGDLLGVCRRYRDDEQIEDFVTVNPGAQSARGQLDTSERVSVPLSGDARPGADREVRANRRVRRRFRRDPETGLCTVPESQGESAREAECAVLSRCNECERDDVHDSVRDEVVGQVG